MANNILNALTGLTTAQTNDLLYVVDVNDLTQGTNGTSKQLSIGNLQAGLTKTGLVNITQPATSATLTIANNKTLTANNSLTLSGTDGTTMAFPNTSDTVTTLTASQTLTNKTLTKPTLNGSVAALTTDADGATITFDMGTSNVHRVTLGGNRTLAVSNTSTGQPFIVILKQDVTGSRTVSWFANILWPNGTAPTLTTTASKQDGFGFLYDGVSYLASILFTNS